MKTYLHIEVVEARQALGAASARVGHSGALEEVDLVLEACLGAGHILGRGPYQDAPLQAQAPLSTLALSF